MALPRAGADALNVTGPRCLYDRDRSDSYKTARRARTGVLAALAVLLMALTVATELGLGPEPRGGQSTQPAAAKAFAAQSGSGDTQ